MKNIMKDACAVGIIGGADGPTSVWIAGKTKEKNIIRRIRNGIWQRQYRKKRARVLADLEKNKDTLDKQVHSLEETCAYIKDKYNAVELQENDRHYQTRLKECKAALVQRYRPDLLGESPQEYRPTDYEDQEALKLYLEKSQEYLKKAEEISLDVFPVDFHYYEMHVAECGTFQIEIEMLHNVFGVSYSAGKGKKKQADKVLQDIYRYYGLTREDIENMTERAKTYVAMMTI